jgi:hypothetical protein
MDCPELKDKHGNVVKHALCILPGSLWIGPADDRVDVFDELMRTKKVNLLIENGMIHADQEVANQLWSYVLRGSYAGMPLHEYLDRIFQNDLETP